MDKFKISRTFFIKTDQEGCALAASDINAANGITLISSVAEALGTPQKNLHSDKAPDEKKGTDKPAPTSTTKSATVAEVILQTNKSQ